jgi:hypothetical protein
MIKIIKTEPDKSVTKEVICKNCGSTLEYTPPDVLQDYFMYHTGEKEYWHFISCPECTCEVRVEG